MNKQLTFRRQFLLTREKVNELGHWGSYCYNDAILYHHPDLQLTQYESSSICIIMLGDIFDAQSPSKSNTNILSDIGASVHSFEELIFAIKQYSGRYVLIFKNQTCFNILSDPLGLREIYYCTEPNLVICGSQPNLLNYYSNPKLGVTQDENIKYFYQHELNKVRRGRMWIGDETYFHAVKKVIPNHYLDIPASTIKRYWPNKKLEIMDLPLATRLSCQYLQGILKAINSRFKIMMAVTSGFDSRSLLAASKQIYKNIYYFINLHEHLHNKSPDIRVPGAIFKMLKIPFHIHTLEGPIDEEFRQIFLNNTFMSTELNLSAIYNIYFKNHSDKVNLLGVGEIGRDMFGKAPVHVDGYYLARTLKYKSSAYAIEQCEKWLQEAKNISQNYNVDLMKLFLWEVLLGNWGVVGNSESDIAIEEFDPYNSHYIYEILLSVNKIQGNIFIEMINYMWPELLKFPINPEDAMYEKIRNWLIYLGLFFPLRRQLYRLERWNYYRRRKT